MCEHVALTYGLAVAVSYTLLSACFDNVLTGCVTVPFSVYSLTTLSQVALQFFFLVCSLTKLSQVLLQFVFQLTFDHKLNYSFFCHFAVCLYMFHQLHSNMCYGKQLHVTLVPRAQKWARPTCLSL